MTVLAERTATTDPVAELTAVVTCLARLDPDRMTADQKAEGLRALSRAEAGIAAAKLQILAAAERSGAAAAAGMASTSQWAARSVNDDPAALHHQVRLAERLERRTITQTALSSGELTAAHAAVIIQADSKLPANLTSSERARVEQSLVEKARTMPPTLLRRAARRAIEAVESDRRIVDAYENAVVVDEEAEARNRTRLSLHDNDDGTVTGHFTVPTLHGHLLRKVIEAITAPRRGRLGAAEAQVGDGGRLSTDWDKARGTAFCELLEHLPTEHLHSRTAATLVVTISEEALRGAVAVAHLDTGAEMSVGEARRLACTAGLLPVVLGGASQPLDVGRETRLFNQAQRTALGVLHQTCAADGCERPFAWCELHHVLEWGRGGPSDLANAIPLCHFHHQRIHDSAFGHEQKPSGVTFKRR